MGIMSSGSIHFMQMAGFPQREKYCMISKHFVTVSRITKATLNENYYLSLNHLSLLNKHITVWLKSDFPLDGRDSRVGSRLYRPRPTIQKVLTEPKNIYNTARGRVTGVNFCL